MVAVVVERVGGRAAHCVLLLVALSEEPRGLSIKPIAPAVASAEARRANVELPAEPAAGRRRLYRGKFAAWALNVSQGSFREGVAASVI